MIDAEPLQNRGPPRRLYASSDIHSPHYLLPFKSSLKTVRECCIFMLAGDIVDRGNVAAAEPVFKAIREVSPGSVIVAVFGNEEYHEREDLFRKRYRDIIWLDDEYQVFQCGEKRIAIVGTRGALEKLTSWQKRNMPWLRRVYNERPKIVANLIAEARKEADHVILLSHYALSRETIKGENPAVWPHLYHPGMEEVVKSLKPDAAVHGHAHRGKPKAFVAGVPVYNVAFPLNRAPVRIAIQTRLF